MPNLDTIQPVALPQDLARPPITEALVDLRIITDHTIDADRLRPLRDELKDVFPLADERRGFQANFRVEAGKLVPPAATDLGFQGIRLKTADGSRIVQFRPDGFTFNNVGLGRYLGGDELLNEALRWWSRYQELTGVAAVVRLALRYLNRLDLPLHHGDQFKKFLVAPPELPPGAPQMVSSFVSRIVAHDDTGAIAVVTQKLDRPKTQATIVPVIIDVDASFMMEMEPKPEHLRGLLEILRTVKNRCFFSLLTDEAVKLYI